MGVVFSPQWLTHGGEHVATQDRALTLIYNAYRALQNTKELELFTWCGAYMSAAPSNSNGNFLRVFKGDHQIEGFFGEIVHLTMSLKIRKNTGEYDHNLYGGAFHLYVEILDPVVGSTKFQLKPTKISYVSNQKAVKEFAINNAAACDSDAKSDRK